MHRYAIHNDPSGWVGVSTSRFQAAAFPEGAGTKTWVYEIPNPGPGISVNKALSFFKRWGSEKEVVYPGGIGPEKIRSATWYEYYKPVGPTVYNPGYMP
jgi:hypothetical protein